MSDKLAQSAAARFFMRVGQASGPWRDENTLPLFPLLLVMDAAMLDADARYEAARGKCLTASVAKEDRHG